MTRTTDPTYPLFPILSCLGFFLSIIPLPWHIQSWNSGTCAFMIWTASLCLVAFINSIIWSDNVNNIAPIWCDISVQVIMGAGIGIPASTLCISRRLYRITTIRTVSITREDKRKAVIQDLFIAVGIPVAVLIMHIPVHPHRFDILEGIGCYPVTYNTLAAYFLYSTWPIILGAVSLVYSCLNIRAFYVRRAQFGQLVATASAMNTSRYLRLMALACADIMFTIPLSSYVVYIGTHGVPLQPWISWADTHFGFGRVDMIPALFWRSNKRLEISIELTRWLCVVCSFLFFALFGFASEAKKHYRLAFWSVTKHLGYKPSPSNGARSALDKFKSLRKDTNILPMHSVGSPSSLQKPVDTVDITLNDYKRGSIEKWGHSPLSSPTMSSPPPTYNGGFRSSVSGSFVTLPDTADTRYSIYSSPDMPIYLSDQQYPSSPSSMPTTPASDNFDNYEADSSREALSTSAPSVSYHLPFIPPSTYPIAIPHLRPGNDDTTPSGSGMR